MRLIEREGKPYLHLLQPGQMLGAGSFLRAGSFRAPAAVVESLPPAQQASLRLDSNDTG